MARLWPWIEISVARRYAFSVVVSIAAVALHWVVYPITQGRASFVFFPPAIILVTTIAGRWPGALVALVGVINSALQKDIDLVFTANSPEQVAIIASAIVSFLLIGVGDYYRSISRRELSDLHELHELSATLASLPGISDQLKLILATLVRMHGADHGAITTLEANRFPSASASTGFDPATLAAAERDLPRAGKERLFVADVDRDSAAAPWRNAALKLGIRALHSTPLISREGEVLGALTVYFTDSHRLSERETRLSDICARKAAVFIERALAEDLANRRDRRLQSVLETSGVPFVMLSPVRDESGKVVEFTWAYLNTSAARIMRCHIADILGRKVTDTLPRAWDEAGRFDLYVDALENNQTREAERQTEADGNTNWYHIVASPVDGDLAIWFADITRRKQQERELLEADRRKDEFLATLAHELRNPLAPIRQAAAIARNEQATEAQKRWSNNVIERQVQHMSLLLDDLLDVSRITHGTLQLRKQDTDLQSIVSAAVETARPLIDERRHRLAIDVPAELHVHADPLRLAQVLSNLLTNAAKYTNPNGAIRVGCTVTGQDLVLWVEDTGIGISAEDLSKVFGMFAQVRSAQEHAAGGLGIGLALAKGVVELHGGRIEVASAGIGKGSRFTVRLPGVVRTVAATGSAGAHGKCVPSAHKRILLADDNRDAAESLAIILRLEGHEVDLAHDGASALRSFESMRPDVALLDIGMPGASGYDVARQIRSRPEGGNVLLIAITGWAQDSDRAQSRAAGFDHHLTKPVEPETLIGLLGVR